MTMVWMFGSLSVEKQLSDLVSLKPTPSILMFNPSGDGMAVVGETEGVTTVLFHV